MAKTRRDSRGIEQRFRPWLENKTERIKSLSKHHASRASSFGAPAGVALVLFITLYSLFLPKNQFEIAKERVLRNTADVEAHLVLAEEFLRNNDLGKAQRELLVVQQYDSQLALAETSTGKQSKVLGLTSWLDSLWQKWQESNPDELKKLITKWEKIVSEIPTYRDGYLYLTLYSFRLGDYQKAKEYLFKALELDPDFKPAREIEKILGN